MVKMRYIFLISFSLHCVFAFSLQNKGSDTKNVFSCIPVSFISIDTKNSNENETASKPEKIHAKAKKSISTTKNNFFKGDETTTTTASVIYGPQPVYPEVAKANGHEAEFIINLLVDTSGNVKNVDIKTLQGDLTWFEETLLQTFKTWKFSKSEKTSHFSIPISFLIDES